MPIGTEGIGYSGETWFSQLVRHWIVESWARKNCLAFGGPCPDEGGIHKLGSAGAYKAQANKKESRY